jgi:curved DNA-binding protein CbpA
VAKDPENYYELLEISETASQEVIDRVYKLLAKKYHPDLNPDNPKAAEEKFKKISAAYDTLSNPVKRKDYDEELKAKRARESINSMNVNRTSSTSSYAPSSSDLYNRAYSKAEEDLIRRKQEELRYQKQKAYDDAYMDAMKKMGIHVTYKKSLKERFFSFLALIITFGVLALVFFIMWHIPYTHDKMLEIYEGSGPIKILVDGIMGWK